MPIQSVVVMGEEMHGLLQWARFKALLLRTRGIIDDDPSVNKNF